MMTALRTALPKAPKPPLSSTKLNNWPIQPMLMVDVAEVMDTMVVVEDVMVAAVAMAVVETTVASLKPL